MHNQKTFYLPLWKEPVEITFVIRLKARKEDLGGRERKRKALEREREKNKY